jgi:penicillin amidase
MLRDWDGDMAADRPEPLIATAWLDRLRRSVFEDELGAAGFRSLEPQRGRLRALERVLTQPAWQGWCDRIDTPATETCAQMLTASLDDALADLTARYGPEPQRWRWAQAHVAVLEHRPFGKHPLLSRLFDLRVPTPGDASTVYAGRAEPLHPSEPYANRWGPAYRAIYDLADLERSQFIHSSGQSGHRLSPRYGEFVERWARVEYLPMRMDRATIERESRESMVLRPR